jgi:hypothetical protein
MVKKILTALIYDGEMTMQKYFSISKGFHGTVLSHLEEWD